MSMSRSASAVSTATRNVIGWSLPFTFRTWAKPSSAPPRETRSTRAESTRSVSTWTPGPKTRWTDSATLSGGADCAATRPGPPAAPAARRPARSRGRALELISHPQAEQVQLVGAGTGPLELVVALEDHVVERPVGEAEGGDAPRQRTVVGHAGGNPGERIVALVADEGVEPLRRGRGERGEDVVGPLHVAALDPAPDPGSIGGVDRLRVRDGDPGQHPAEHEGADVVARIGRDEGDGVVEGSGPEQGIGRRAPAVPEGAAHPEPRPDPLQAPGERRVGEARVRALLAAAADARLGAEAARAEAVEQVHPVAQPGRAGQGPHHTDAELAPGRGDHVPVEGRAIDPVEGGGLVHLVDDPDRREEEPAPNGDRGREPVVHVGLLERKLATGLAALEPGVLDLELGAERDAVAELVGEIDHE